MSSEQVTFLNYVAQKYSLEYLDLSPFFEAERDYLIPDDGHWNKKGNNIAAIAITNWFKDLGLEIR